MELGRQSCHEVAGAAGRGPPMREKGRAQSFQTVTAS